MGPLLNSCQFMFDRQSLTMMIIVRCNHLNNLMIVYDHDVSHECFVSTEVLVLGTGGRSERIDPKVLALLKSKGIAVEVQDTVGTPDLTWHLSTVEGLGLCNRFQCVSIHRPVCPRLVQNVLLRFLSHQVTVCHHLESSYPSIHRHGQPLPIE